MELSQVIVGQIVTEKSEALKAAHKTYTVTVAPKATKVDIKKALKKYYDVDATSVRIIRTRPKTRLFRRGAYMEKRHRSKKALITLDAKSKAFDLSNFKAS